MNLWLNPHSQPTSHHLLTPHIQQLVFRSMLGEQMLALAPIVLFHGFRRKAMVYLTEENDNIVHQYSFSPYTYILYWYVIMLKHQLIPSGNAPSSAPVASRISFKRYLPDISYRNAEMIHVIRISQFAEYAKMFAMSPLKFSNFQKCLFWYRSQARQKLRYLQKSSCGNDDV